MTTCQSASRFSESMDEIAKSLLCNFHECHYNVVHVRSLRIENQHERHNNDNHGRCMVGNFPISYTPSFHRNARPFDRSSFSGAFVYVPTSVPNFVAYLNTPETFIAPVHFQYHVSEVNTYLGKFPSCVSFSFRRIQKLERSFASGLCHFSVLC